MTDQARRRLSKWALYAYLALMVALLGISVFGADGEGKLWWSVALALLAVTCYLLHLKLRPL